LNGSSLGSTFGSGGGSLRSLVIRNVSWLLLNNPLVAKSVLGVSEVSLRVNNVMIELGVEVVHDVLGFIVVLGLRLRSSHNKLVSVHSLCDRKTVHGSNGIGVTSVIGDWVVESITERSLLVSILGATSRAADGIRVDLHSLGE
jgi:hypothetical protein